MTIGLSFTALCRRAAALGLLMLLVLGVYLVAVSPVLDRYLDDRATAAQLQMALERHGRVASDLAALRAELASLQTRRPSQSGYLPGTNETIAAAGLQARIKTAVSRAGGDLRTMEIIAPQPDGKLQKIALRAQMVIGLAGLQQVLYALNETPPFLFFDGLDIRLVSDGPRSQRPSQRIALTVEFNAYGYFWRNR